MSNFIELTPDLVAVFLDEAPTYLATIENGLMALERGGCGDGAGGAATSSADNERIADIFRAAHSLKGVAASLGFQRIAELTHGMESLFEQLRGGRRVLDSAGVAALLGAVDCLRGLLRECATPGSGPVPIDEARAGLQRLLDQPCAAAPSAALGSTRAGRGTAAGESESRPAQIAPGDDATVELHVGFDEQAVDAPIRACILFNRFAGLGVVVRTEPDIRELDHDAPDRHFSYWVRTRADHDDFARAVEDCDIATFTLRAHASMPVDASAVAPACEEPHPLSAPETLRVDVAQIDRLGVLGAELSTIGQRITSLVRRVERVSGSAELAAIARELDASALELNRSAGGLRRGLLAARLVTIRPLFQHGERLVRDLAASLGKSIEVVLEGADTRFDRRLLDELLDPLTHLIRNAVDHGVEAPEWRAAAGKSRSGRIVLAAGQRGAGVCIDVRDDGSGIDFAAVRRQIVQQGLAGAERVARMPDSEACDYIFRPGFSTAARVTELSGRGVGLDVVRTRVGALRGTVSVQSRPGAGTTISITLPLTLAITRALPFRVGATAYAVPLQTAFRVLERGRPAARRARVLGSIAVGGGRVPLVALDHVLGGSDAGRPLVARTASAGGVLVLGADERRVAVVVGEFLAPQDLAVQRLPPACGAIPAVSGAAILNDGAVALVLDVAAIVERLPPGVTSSAAPS